MRITDDERKAALEALAPVRPIPHADERDGPITRDTSPAMVLWQLAMRNRNRQVVEYSGP